MKDLTATDFFALAEHYQSEALILGGTTEGMQALTHAIRYRVAGGMALKIDLLEARNREVEAELAEANFVLEGLRK